MRKRGKEKKRWLCGTCSGPRKKGWGRPNSCFWGGVAERELRGNTMTWPLFFCE